MLRVPTPLLRSTPSADIAGCTNTGKALDAPIGVAVSPDGKHVYVTSIVSDAVAVFRRK